MSTENEVKDLNAMSDQELSECFAVEVALWRFHKGDEKETWVVLHDDWWITTDKLDRRGPATMFKKPHPFATSADTILPWLEKCRSWKAASYSNDGIWVDVDAPTYGQGYAATFPRAACCALIAAKRAAKEATP